MLHGALGNSGSLRTSKKLPKKFSANDLLKVTQSVQLRPESPEALIREGLENLSNGRPATARSIGYILKNKRDRRVGNLRLLSSGKNSVGALWQVQAD